MQGETLSTLKHVAPPKGEFAEAVLTGLGRRQKSLPCRLLYDKQGSELFEQITRQQDYYPTRTETAILSQYARDMLEDVPEDSALIEFGSGSSVKTEILLRELPVDIDYVAVDVSRAALTVAEKRLSKRFPKLNIHPIVADFLKPVTLPACLLLSAKIGFFPGSTISNFSPVEAARPLRHFRQILGQDARLISGVDLKKDESILVRAYDDADGITADFNLNVLARINRELGSNIDLLAFRHRATYNRGLGRIEMHLVSLTDQEVRVLDHAVKLSRGETIHTENSYKYTSEDFQALARSASWTPVKVWTDAENLFSVHELR